MKDQALSLHHTLEIRSLALGITSLGIGSLSFLALASRLERFWYLSRWPRLTLFVFGALMCSLLVAMVLFAAWRYLSSPPRVRKWIWLGLAFILGIGVRLAVGLPAPSIPFLYTLEITTGGSVGHGPVKFLELHDPSGRLIPSADFKVEGAWQRTPQGFTTQGNQPAILHYSFYAAAKGQLQLLFEEQAQGSQVLLRINGQEQQVNLGGSAGGQRIVELSFLKLSRWDLPVAVADWVLLGLVLPLFLFVAPFYLSTGFRWVRPQTAAAGQWLAARLNYQAAVIVIFVALLLLPLQGYKGDWQAFEGNFWGFRPLWQIDTLIRYRVFRDRVFGSVLAGQNNWLVYTGENSLDDFQRTIPYTDEQLFQIQQGVDGMTRFLQQKGITFLVVVAPNKNTIYPEYMPRQIQVIGKQSRLDQVIAYQQQHGQAQILDLRPALLQARQERPVFYETDTHWNPYGAYAGYVQVINSLQKEFPNLKPHALNEYRYTIDAVKRGDLASNWLQSASEEPFFLLDPVFERNVSRFELLQERVLYSFRYNDSASGMPRAVVYHDSFMAWLSPFLSDHFSKAVYIWSGQIDEQYIDSEKPDIVIFECTERYLDYLLNLPHHNLPGE